MSRWFRVYSELIDDPKFIRLGPDLRSALFMTWCVAAVNDGRLPSLEDMAIKFRLSETRTQKLVTELQRCGFIDVDEDGLFPHNWSGRQYKSDTSNERVKQLRERRRNVTPTVTVTPPETEQKQNTEQIDKIGEGASKFTEGSKKLTDAFWKALGIESSLQVPIEFAGTDWRALEWENAGWTVDLIDAEARRIGPGKPLTYYEKVFATSFAKRQAPLPIVEIRDAEKLMVTHGTAKNQSGGSLIAALDRKIAALEAEDGADLALSESSVLRISG